MFKTKEFKKVIIISSIIYIVIILLSLIGLPDFRQIKEKSSAKPSN